MSSTKRFLRPRTVGILFAQAKIPLHANTGIRFSSTAHATIVDRGFWKSLVPKPLRRENRTKLKAKQKEWNPATFFIVMFLFIGSMSIQMIALRNQFDKYMRQSSVRISQLREVVERIQNGEDVDVEKVLGTGDPQKEADWEEVLRAIERDETEANNQKKSKRKEATPKAVERQASTNEVPSEASESTGKSKNTANFGNFF